MMAKLMFKSLNQISRCRLGVQSLRALINGPRDTSSGRRTLFTGSPVMANESQKRGDFNYLLELNSEQQAIVDLARKFARTEIMPEAAKLDQSGEFPQVLIEKFWKLGLLNTIIPTEYGGMDLGLFLTVLIVEELTYACNSFSTSAGASWLGQTPLIGAGSHALKKKYLGRMIEAPLLAAYAVTEPDGGSDVAAVRTKAVLKGDEYILNGSKLWISNAGVCNWMYVLARTSPDLQAPTSKAFTGFIVEKDWPGVVIGPKLWNMGLRCADTRGITFEDVRVPKENVVGSEGEGFKISMKTFDKTRPLTSASACGLAKRALDEAVKYSMQRKTFGKLLCEHGMIQEMLANMAVNLEAALVLTRISALKADLGLPNTMEASIGKLLSAKAAMDNSMDAVQVHGAYGYNRDFPVEKLMRDSKIHSIYEGTNQIQKLVIARHVLARAKDSKN